MGGIEAFEEMTKEQLEAVSGGELLRQEAGNFSQVLNSLDRRQSTFVRYFSQVN